MAPNPSPCLLTALLALYSCLGFTRSDASTPGVQTAVEAEAIRKKYGAKDFVRDMEHLKEDLAKITELQMEGKLTDEEMVFYFFRMHDFDDNNLLDGLELLAAIKHTEEHQVRDLPTPPLDHMISAVDAMLELDKDNDGYLNYFELRSST